MDSILASVARKYFVTPEDLRGRDDRFMLADARGEAMLRMYEAGNSYPKIGRFMERDHSSVFRAVARYRSILLRYPSTLGVKSVGSGLVSHPKGRKSAQSIAA